MSAGRGKSRYRPGRAILTGREGVVFATTTVPGAKSLFRGQLRWFRDQGWHPVLVSSPSAESVALSEREGVPLVGIPMNREISLKRDLRSLAEWLCFLRRTRPAAVNVGTPKAALLGTVAGWLTGVPKRLYTVRGLRLEGARGFEFGVLWLMEWITATLATDVIPVSASLGDKLRALHLTPTRKMWLIGAGSSNGVDAAAVRAAADSAIERGLRRELGFCEEDFVVGFMGRVTGDKGINTLVSAMSLTDAECVKLLVVGRVEDQESEALLSALGKRLVRIEWTDDAWGHLAVLDALVLPTLREGFPNVVLEAAACGVPAIVTQATGAVDSVEHAQTGYHVPVGDARSIAQCVEKLAANPGMAQQLGAQARARALAAFQPEHVWLGVEEILASDSHPRYAKRWLKKG